VGEAASGEFYTIFYFCIFLYSKKVSFAAAGDNFANFIFKTVAVKAITTTLKGVLSNKFLLLIRHFLLQQCSTSQNSSSNNEIPKN
jgi:hypothetical protein